MSRGKRSGSAGRAAVDGPGGADLLARVGRVVRAARQAVDMSRRALSERSGVSVRYLARLEGGTGNISLLRLDAIAVALGVPLLYLLSAPAGPTALRVALLGLRGAGKSTIGAALARRLHVPFLELDTLIEEAAGLPLGQIFELHGERHFRRLERETLARFLSGASPAVLATGGGLVTDSDTYALLRGACTTVWLAARAEDHYARVVAQGDRRPMADNPHAMAELRALLSSRRDLYELADLRIDTSAVDVPTAVRGILARLPGAAKPRKEPRRSARVRA
ncbi:MAG TPA: shikimate kinase [Candidatus Polarisedimenticolia bacterium]|nr:shikimate kinase [Candidatus Polarisedimenticolia bacterium]